MKGYLDGELGMISIDSEVIARYAGSTAVECFGIVGMAAVSMKDGLVKLLKGDSLTRGIKVDIDEDNKITIDFHVIVLSVELFGFIVTVSILLSPTLISLTVSFIFISSTLIIVGSTVVVF